MNLCSLSLRSTADQTEVNIGLHWGLGVCDMANPRQLDGDRHSNRKARQYVATAGALVS